MLTVCDLALEGATPVLDPTQSELDRADLSVSLVQDRSRRVTQLLVGGRADRSSLRQSLSLAVTGADERGRMLALALVSNDR